MDRDGFQREMLAALGHQVYVLSPAVAPTPGTRPGAEGSSLLEAIARAAGVAPGELPPLPPVEALRTPAGKRAAWPRLRALRRSRR